MLKTPTKTHQAFVEYASEYFKKYNMRGLLKGSLANGNANKFSDIDLVIMETEKSLIEQFITNYRDIALLSFTQRPKGILIIIYNNGICVDLEIRKTITFDEYENGFVMGKDFCKQDFSENITRCDALVESIFHTEDDWYNMLRLFHRSLIKWLGGKREAGYEILLEINDFLAQEGMRTVKSPGVFKEDFFSVYQEFGLHYQFPEALDKIIKDLVQEL